MFEGINEMIKNPALFFMKSRFKVPQNLNTPNEIIDYLLQSRQLSQDQINQVYARYKDLQGSGGLPTTFK